VLLPSETPEADFAAALNRLVKDRRALRQLGESARQSVNDFGLPVCADRLLELYAHLAAEYAQREDADPGPWDRLLARLEIEWNLFVEKTSALSAAVVETEATRSQLD
jgi:1,2-diacylglycerol 3-alpha-glucosyltransferase